MVAAIAVLLLVAAGGWYARLVVEQRDTPVEGSPEVGFARDMSEHHQQAVYLAMLAVEYGSTSDVRQFGSDVVLVQQAEIGTMLAWLADWRVPATSTTPSMAWMAHASTSTTGEARMPGMASDEELRALLALRGRAFDVLFYQLMLRHHLGGSHMVDAILARTGRAEVARLARTMSRTQGLEVAELTRYLSI